jgi:hypothetical protein
MQAPKTDDPTEKTTGITSESQGDIFILVVIGRTTSDAVPDVAVEIPFPWEVDRGIRFSEK